FIFSWIVPFGPQSRFVPRQEGTECLKRAQLEFSCLHTHASTPRIIGSLMNQSNYATHCSEPSSMSPSIQRKSKDCSAHSVDLNIDLFMRVYIERLLKYFPVRITLELR